MIVHLDYDRIMKRTPAELEVENRWWNSLPPEAQREWLDRCRKEDEEKDRAHLCLAIFVGVAVFVLSGIIIILGG